MRYYKFVKWDAANLAEVLQNPIPKALEEYDNGNKKPFNDMQIATTTPEYKCGGWCFPLTDYLRRFWVKTKYCGIVEYFAPNKTAIRKAVGSHNIIKIVEV